MLPPNAGSERKNADIKYIGEMLFPARCRLARAGGRLFPPSPRPNIPRAALTGPGWLDVRLPTRAACPTQRTLACGTQRTLACGTQRTLARGTRRTRARRPREQGQERLTAPSALFTDAAFAITSVRPIRVSERGAGI